MTRTYWPMSNRFSVIELNNVIKPEWSVVDSVSFSLHLSCPSHRQLGGVSGCRGVSWTQSSTICTPLVT